MDIKERIIFFARASSSLSFPDRKRCDKLCEVGKASLKQLRSCIIASSDDDPIMQNCSADGTPISVSHSVLASIPHHPVVKRSGRKCSEFLTSCEFTRSISSDGGVQTVVNTEDPRPLQNGKSTARIFETCRSSWRSVRQHRSRRPCVQSYSFDRCGIDSLRRFLLAWHVMVRACWAESDAERNYLRLTEWVEVVACALHDVQSSFRWSMPHRFEDRDLLKHVWLSAAAIRQSFDAVIRFLHHWVRDTVISVADWTEYEAAGWRELWTYLRIDPVTISLLLSCQLRFEDGKLKTGLAHVGPDEIEMFVYLLLGV